MMPLVDIGLVLDALARDYSLCRFADARCRRTFAWLAAQHAATKCAESKGWCGR